VAVPGLGGFVVPIAVGIIVALFAIQRFGTTSIGRAFGPIMVAWFAVLALLGLAHVVAQPTVLQAVNPVHMVRFFADNGFQGFLSLGSVFLVVTGGEALYADLGHFGRGPIRTGWFAMVLPALVLNYFGQGALLIGNPEAIESPFYRMAPGWAVLPLVALATMATVIASQALISGVFSLTMQAIQFSYLPRMRVVHTSASAFGQIYIPAVNWALMVACVALVLGFRSSTALAAAYGVAVTSTMVITTLLFYVVSRERFGWSAVPATAFAVGFGVIDLAFLSANLFKIPEGGWFPLVVAAAVFAVLMTWKTGKRLVAERLPHGHLPISDFVERLSHQGPPPQRVPGSALYLYARPGQTPPAMIANVEHNNALHSDVAVLSVLTDDLARVPPERRVEVHELGDGVRQVTVRYGFLEQPDVPQALREAGVRPEIDGDFDEVYIVGAEALVVTDQPGMARWREHLFALLNRNATPAARYFGLPQERTMILAQQVNL
jgi:KUP system potassium uptake protein